MRMVQVKGAGTPIGIEREREREYLQTSSTKEEEWFELF